jgi:hypothetical protein
MLPGNGRFLRANSPLVSMNLRRAFGKGLSTIVVFLAVFTHVGDPDVSSIVSGVKWWIFTVAFGRADTQM